MALFSRIFSPKKSCSNEKIVSNQSSFKEFRPFSFPFEKNSVRVLLFRECDWRGRKLLFDSTSVEKILLDPKTPSQKPRSDSEEKMVEMSNGYGYMYKKPCSDTTVLGETVFGSIAMATRGPSLKIHSLKDPPRLMFTKIIQAPRARVRRRVSDEKASGGSQRNSVNSMTEHCPGGSFDSTPGRLGSFEATVSDSGLGGGRDSSRRLSSDWLRHLSPQRCLCGSLCPLHPPSHNNNEHANSSSSLHSNSSLSSLRRRWARSVATSLHSADCCQPQPQPVSGKHTKLAVAVIVPLITASPQEMEQFLIERTLLINKIITRLQHSTEQAYCRRDVFVQSMLQASSHAAQSFKELLCGPRMDGPLWLSLTSEKTDPAARSEMARRLVDDLSYLLSTLDTKHTNFFVSTLLTAVLTHHLGWVPTVLLDKPLRQSNTLFADLSRSHPYNPLWAQLSDLQGALGYPPKVAKTVVIGRSEGVVQKLLSVLSYFIRCGQVSEAGLSREVPSDEEDLLEQLLEPGPDKSLYDKDAIREFNQATSDEPVTSTLTKSKTVLTLKTFCITDYDVENANSLESGFESSNDFSGESYEDGTKTGKLLKHSKLKKTTSSSKILETSFLQGKEENLNEETGFEKGNSSPLSIMKVVENDTNSVSKTESEIQFTAAHVLDVVNSKSKLSLNCSRKNSFIKENFQSSVTEVEEKESKVVFVLGENEELINIKGQDDAKVSKVQLDVKGDAKEVLSDFEPPIILIDNFDSEVANLAGERCETEHKTDFVPGEVSDKVVIARSIPVYAEVPVDSRCLRTGQRPRCLSVPEEAVSETEWVKSRRCKEVIRAVRRWLSDSAIELASSESSVSESVVRLKSDTPASVFRTSHRPLEHTKRGSLGELTSSVVPAVQVDDEDEPPLRPKSTDGYIKLPSQISEVVSRREVGVAASLFGAISDSYCSELVLQGVSQTPQSWALHLQHLLQLEAHSQELDSDLAEAVCIVANTDTWEVGLVSSHSLTVGGGGCEAGMGTGVRVGMSQLVANMLDTLQQLYKLSLPASLCLSHVESKLGELCVRSQALAELLLTSDFLDMDTLTATLDLESNDVPLLLSVASAHTPLVTRKYGLSFQ